MLIAALSIPTGAYKIALLDGHPQNGTYYCIKDLNEILPRPPYDPPGVMCSGLYARFATLTTTLSRCSPAENHNVTSELRI